MEEKKEVKEEVKEEAIKEASKEKTPEKPKKEKKKCKCDENLKKIEELQSALLRMQADNINYRKRKDEEAAVSYYEEQGIPEEAVKEYLLNIANSTFENWRRANPDKDISEFQLQINKMSVSGALFDMVKLLDVGKTVISKFTAEKVYDEALKWAKRHDEELEKLLENKEY